MLSFGLTYYVCDLVGFVYPAYASFKALETKETGDDIQWLTYWVVYAVFMTLDVFAGELLGWIPLFYEMKLLFIIWMIVPQFKGAKVMYDNYIKPFLTKHASRFDPIFETTTKIIDNPAMGAAISMAQQYGPEVAAKALQMATENAASIAEDLKKKGTETSKDK
eukprot:evm.model.scf_3238.2 EVM.evm.TU.scf_3238.2   scf_3238:7083-9310(+)